jgi:hypothetical protein
MVAMDSDAETACRWRYCVIMFCVRNFFSTGDLDDNTS